MRILKVIVGAFLFVACVFIATANMHPVRLVFPDVPLRGWPHLGETEAPLFVVLLTTLFLGVLLAGLSTLLEQVRLRTVARRARKEQERAVRAREEAERARDVAEKEREAARTELEQARSELATARSTYDQAQAEIEKVRAERDALSAERAALRIEVEPMRADAPAHTGTVAFEERTAATQPASADGEEPA